MNHKPKLLPVNPEFIPTELRDISAWIGWKLVQRNGRWSKEPININNGALAETDNPATWCNFQTAVERMSAWVAMVLDCVGRRT